MQLKERATRELSDPERWQELAANYPYGRLAEVKEIAQAAVFLCSLSPLTLTPHVLQSMVGLRMEWFNGV